MLSRCRGAIFDMDGTLLDSMRYWRFGSLEYAVAHKWALPKDISVYDILQNSSRKMIVRLAEYAGAEYDVNVFEPEYNQRMYGHYMTEIQPKPGALEFLQYLKRRGIPACIATAAPKWCAEGVMQRHGLLEYFDFVTSIEEMGIRKTESRFFDIVAERLGVPVGDCYVFEDALYAMQTAKHAGCGVCAIEDYTAERDREEIKALADVYAADYIELLKHIEAEGEV